eukprot:7538648-Pyramimonas_sp.AAC.1
MERFLGESSNPRPISSGSFGAPKFAYTPGRGARGALLWLVLFCLHSFEGGTRVGSHLSDVSGAFDKVKHPAAGE